MQRVLILALIYYAFANITGILSSSAYGNMMYIPDVCAMSVFKYGYKILNYNNSHVMIRDCNDDKCDKCVTVAVPLNKYINGVIYTIMQFSPNNSPYKYYYTIFNKDDCTINNLFMIDLLPNKCVNINNGIYTSYKYECNHNTVIKKIYKNNNCSLLVNKFLYGVECNNPFYESIFIKYSCT